MIQYFFHCHVTKNRMIRMVSPHEKLLLEKSPVIRMVPPPPEKLFLEKSLSILRGGIH